MVSKHFTVKEALWLPSWQVMHIPSEEEKTNILAHAAVMDRVRDFLGVPLQAHCWLRPILNNPSSPYHGQDYNAYVQGASHSAHKVGLATDFNPVGMTCDEAKSRLIGQLETFNIRMEDLPVGSGWNHVDSASVISSRLFKP